MKCLMPCCLFSVLLSKNACADNIIEFLDFNNQLFKKNEFALFEQEPFNFNSNRLDEIQTPILYKHKKGSGKTRLIALSTARTKDQGFRVRGLTFYYMPNENTRWRLKLRRSKINLEFRVNY